MGVRRVIRSALQHYLRAVALYRGDLGQGCTDWQDHRGRRTQEFGCQSHPLAVVTR